MASETNGVLGVGLVVRDLDVCLRFYTEGVGFAVGTRIEFDGGELRNLHLGDAVLKLVALDPTPDDENPSGGLRAATGLRYLAAWIDDLEAVVTASIAAGGVEIARFRSMDGSTIVILADPEGNHIECKQR